MSSAQLTEDYTQDYFQEDLDTAHTVDRWIRDQLTHIAQQMGLKQVPLRDPGVSFYRFGYETLWHYGIRGQDLTHTLHRILQDLFFNANTGEPGSIYTYPEYYRQTKRPFEDFFWWVFKQKLVILYRRRFWRDPRKKKSLPVRWEPKSDSEKSGDRLSREEVSRLLRETVPQMLTGQRDGNILRAVWTYWLQGLNLQEISDRLNQDLLLRPAEDRGGRKPKGERLWSVGTVHRVRDRMFTVVRNYLGEQGIDLSDLKNFEIAGE